MKTPKHRPPAANKSDNRPATLPQWLGVKSHRGINALEAEMAKLIPVDMPVMHRFTPGLYIRQITMYAGTLLTSKIHKTEHPFVVSKGRAVVWTPDGGKHIISAPYTGITKPGTRRVLYILEDCIWTTFHRTDETDLAKIEAELIEPHEVSLEQLREAQKCLGVM